MVKVCLREEGGTILEILLVTTYPGGTTNKYTNVTSRQTYAIPIYIWEEKQQETNTKCNKNKQTYAIPSKKQQTNN